MATITINGNEYTLVGNLRVAYNLQGKHNHKPYMDILSGVGDMPIEKQIELLYLAFEVGNPAVAKEISAEAFRAIILDDPAFNTTRLMQLIKQVIAGILGKDLPDVGDANTTSDEASSGKN